MVRAEIQSTQQAWCVQGTTRNSCYWSSQHEAWSGGDEAGLVGGSQISESFLSRKKIMVWISSWIRTSQKLCKIICVRIWILLVLRWWCANWGLRRMMADSSGCNSPHTLMWHQYYFLSVLLCVKKRTAEYLRDPLNIVLSRVWCDIFLSLNWNIFYCVIDCISHVTYSLWIHIWTM